jgi:hypothetical protein
LAGKYRSFCCALRKQLVFLFPLIFLLPVYSPRTLLLNFLLVHGVLTGLHGLHANASNPVGDHIHSRTSGGTKVTCCIDAFSAE